jgi:prepilin-type N-terminal cleavage/methylation domain-containing protein
VTVLLCDQKFSSNMASRARRAFTLVELMIVIGLIALLLGAVGLSLSGPGVSTLASAQNTLAALVATARAQAAVKQKETLILIYGTRPPNGDVGKYLRYIRVVIAPDSAVTTATTRWEPIGTPVLLPSGVCVVPPSTSGLLATGVIWPTNPAPVSSFINLTASRKIILNEPAASAADTYFELKITPEGIISPAAAKLAVATTTVTNGLPQFTNAGAVRGLAFRTSGAVTRVNEPGSF